MSINKMSYKGQIVIPKELRDKYGLKPESGVIVTELDGHIALIPILDDPVKDTKGILKRLYPEKVKPLDEIMREYKVI